MQVMFCLSKFHLEMSVTNKLDSKKKNTKQNKKNLPHLELKQNTKTKTKTKTTKKKHFPCQAPPQKTCLTQTSCSPHTPPPPLIVFVDKNLKFWRKGAFCFCWSSQ